MQVTTNLICPKLGINTLRFAYLIIGASEKAAKTGDKKLRAHCVCGSSVFLVHVPEGQEDTIVLICFGCKKPWPVKVDCLPKTECSKCHSVTFIVHTPPKNAKTKDKIVYLICDECRALQNLKFGELLEADVYGVLKEKRR
jgi:hypothetical protein